METTYALIEGGGTKFVVAAARPRDEVLRIERIATGSREQTLGHTLAFFAQAKADFGSFAAAGIGSFGPVDVDRSSPTWGHILATPKPGWNGVDIAGTLAAALHCPVGFDTDVNAATLAEARWGAAQTARVSTYVTAGTGSGAGWLRTVARCTARGIPSLVTLGPSVTCATASSSACASFTAAASKGWRAGQPFRRAGGRACRSCPPTTRLMRSALGT